MQRYSIIQLSCCYGTINNDKNTQKLVQLSSLNNGNPFSVANTGSVVAQVTLLYLAANQTKLLIPGLASVESY